MKHSSAKSASEEAQKYDLSGMVAIVTGGNTGLGKATVSALVMAGAHVIIACRSIQKGQQAKDDIESDISALGVRINGGVHISVMKLDLSSLKSVKEFADTFIRSKRELHILVNNAGICMPPTFGTTDDGIERQWGVNYLAHFYLTNLLMPVLKTTADHVKERRDAAQENGHHDKAPYYIHGVRIVNIASNAANYTTAFEKTVLPPVEKGYKDLASYGMSKLCNYMHAKCIAERLGDQYKDTIKACALHPGVVKTDITRDVTGINKFCYDCFSCLLKTPDRGAATILYCALSPNIDNDPPGGAYADGKLVRDVNDATSQANRDRLWEVSEDTVERIIRGYSS